MSKVWAEIVTKIGENDSSLTIVDISDKNLGSRGSAKLGSALKKNRVVSELDLSNNSIGDQGFISICQGIIDNPKSKVKSIDFSGNDITTASSEMVEQLTGNEITLNLSENPINKKKRKRTARKDSSKSSKRDKRKSTKKNKDEDKMGQDEVSEIENQPVEVIDSKRKILEARIAALEKKEEEYLSQIEELETRVKELNRGTLSKLNSGIFSSKGKTKSKTAMTVSTKSIIITQKMAEGGGSSAEVYSCIVDGWLVVMKELSTSSMSQASIESFSREIRMLELLPPHENIARYLFHDVKDHCLRLFMTHYDCSLGHYIRQTRESKETISIKMIYKILLDIIRGIEFLHSHNIMHRDLKGDNIFILYGERKEIQLCAIGDFDTAKQESNTKTVLGTPAWMAPEVMAAADSNGYGFPCDVYGFGMIIFELITLQAPFHNVNTMRVPMLVMQGKRPEIPDDIPTNYSNLITLFEQCTAFKPEERPLPSKLKSVLALGLANA